MGVESNSIELRRRWQSAAVLALLLNTGMAVALEERDSPAAPCPDAVCPELDAALEGVKPPLVRPSPDTVVVGVKPTAATPPTGATVEGVQPPASSPPGAVGAGVEPAPAAPTCRPGYVCPETRSAKPGAEPPAVGSCRPGYICSGKTAKKAPAAKPAPNRCRPGTACDRVTIREQQLTRGQKSAKEQKPIDPILFARNTVQDVTRKTKNPAKAVDALNFQAFTLFQGGQRPVAVELARQTLAYSQKQLGEKHPAYAGQPQ